MTGPPTPQRRRGEIVGGGNERHAKSCSLDGIERARKRRIDVLETIASSFGSNTNQEKNEVNRSRYMGGLLCACVLPLLVLQMYYGCER